MRCLGSMTLTVTLFCATAAPAGAAPLGAPFGWENGASRQFSLTGTGSGHEFWLEGFGAFEYDTLVDCCTTALAPVIVTHSDASLRFWNLAVNGYFVSTEFHGGLDLGYFTTAIGDLNDVTGFVELSWPDYEAQVMSINFAVEEPGDGNVPEPVTLALVGAGLVGLGVWHRRRR